jgi:hypothetical protein
MRYGSKKLEREIRQKEGLPYKELLFYNKYLKRS